MTLLPVYHRFYDATLLFLPALWLMSVMSSPRQRPGLAGRIYRWAAWIPLLVFMVAGSAILYTAITRWEWLPQAWIDVPWGRAVLLHHQTLALLLLIVLQLIGLGAFKPRTP